MHLIFLLTFISHFLILTLYELKHIFEGKDKLNLLKLVQIKNDIIVLNL